MKSLKVFCVLAVLVVSSFAFGVVENFNGIEVDIEYWTGFGANEALLVVDWNEGGNEAVGYAFGFRWDDGATGRDMLNAVNSTSRFYEVVDDGLLAGSGNTIVYGMGYDVDNDGGSFMPTASGVETGYATDVDDLYNEGWMIAGFWGYNQSTDGVVWGYAGFGITDRVLADGDWDGFSYGAASAGWSGGDPTAPIVPEPISLALLGLGGLLVKARRS